MSIQICGAPCCWDVDDPKNPYLPPWTRVLEEAGKAGYSAIELGPYGYLPIDAELVANELRKNGLAIVAGTIFHDLTDAENQEVVLEDRYQLASDPKKRIAQAAVAMIREGMTVILDSGSTTLLIAEALVRMTNITVITNSLPAAFTLAENKDITLVVCGGTVRHKTHSMHGTIAERSLQGICADLMFVGADGIDATNGITTFNEGYSISSVMAAAAHQVIAVLDASKFNRRGFNQVLPMEKIDCVITDDGISENDRTALSSKKVELKIV